MGLARYIARALWWRSRVAHSALLRSQIQLLSFASSQGGSLRSQGGSALMGASQVRAYGRSPKGHGYAMTLELGRNARALHHSF